MHIRQHEDADIDRKSSYGGDDDDDAIKLTIGHGVCWHELVLADGAPRLLSSAPS